MYNLLVTAQNNAWEEPYYIYDKSRFLEYTDNKIADKFTPLNDINIETIKEIPSLFSYEGKDDFVSLGFITSVKERENGKKLLIEFKIILKDFIPFSSLEPFSDFLDIRRWEMNRTHWAIKDDDLIESLNKNKLIKRRNLRLFKEAIISLNNERLSHEIDNSINTTRLDTNNLNEEKISSLRGFISKVITGNKNNSIEVFYRGHSDKDEYKLEPSLFRKDKDGNYLYLDNEDTLYRELITSNPSEFSLDQYTLDKLMRMQHYSLPTRLLDITSNPLIALYFACKTNDDKKGEVIIFSVSKNEIKYFDSDTASCISNLARLAKEEKDSISFEINKEEFNNQLEVKRLLHFIKEEKSFFEPKIISSDLKKIICVKGKKNNDRIASQSGAFLLFGYNTIFNEKGTDNIEIRRITVENKKKILDELDLLNINESTVFPYIENSAKYVANKFKFNK